jgi:hypothetical protein
MKDWKAEYDKLKGQNQELQEQIRYLRLREESRQSQSDQLRDKFKELLIEVLGR